MSSKSSNKQNQMKLFYRQRKKADTAITKSSSSSSKKSHSASATLGSDITQPTSLPFVSPQPDPKVGGYGDREEEVLRQFDMNMAYGPCLGMSRLERWDRASRLGLNPPEEIRVLLGDPDSADARSRSLWDGRI